jgi:hypothetical protein
MVLKNKTTGAARLQHRQMVARRTCCWWRVVVRALSRVAVDNSDIAGIAALTTLFTSSCCRCHRRAFFVFLAALIGISSSARRAAYRCAT